MPHTDYEIHSNEMQEIIGYIPHWITRWGIVVLFISLLMTIFISYTVKYPDTLNATVIIQSKEQPGKVTITRSDASIEFVFLVKEKQEVKKGDTLLIEKDTQKGISKPTITPMKGTIYITKGIDDKNTQDIVLWVVPKAKTYDTKIKYSKNGAGRVKIGQDVIIHLDNYPEDEFGFLEGKISSTLPVSNDGNTEAYISLKKGLLTNRNIKLPMEHMLQGEGEILLNDKSIFSRLFGGLIPKK